jgi:type III restriction enzyme
MAYAVDRVVICDAYAEPDAHYQLLAGGKSKRVPGRRPSMRYLASAIAAKGGIAGIVGREASLFEDMLPSLEQRNEFVNALRDEVRDWRDGGYQGTAIVTRRLLEWWFERDEEREATGRRFFFCQQEAVETVIYLYEVKNRHKMPETNDLLRYALKLATGTGKTIVMALLVTWATLHKRKVSGSSLSANFLVLAPNLTVRDRVSGVPRGDGLDPSGAENLYDLFDTVPPEYHDEFHPNVLVRNWQAVPLEAQRDDWIPEDIAEEGRFVPASVLWALRRRARQDPNAPIRRLLGGWRDLVVINDEAHHVYGEKKTKKGEDPEYIKWHKILERIGKAARISLVVDLSATPWYGSGSPKPEGTLFEWLVCDFSVYDAFESGLVKVVRLPDPEERGAMFLDLWDMVKGAKTREEYLSACKSAVATIYASWKTDFEEWSQTLAFARGPSPVMLVVTSDATRAGWIFEHLTKDYELLRNPDEDDRRRWVTIQVDSKVFDADRGNEAVLREMVNTVGKKRKRGERVRCIVSVNMLSEGWDVQSVTHILGLRAFGSPLLTEQIIGRGLRRTNYDVLNQPLAERPEGYEETVDAFGIPFVGFPVQRRKRARAGQWGQKPVWIEKDNSKQKHRLQVPNVRSWAVGVTEPLTETIRVRELPELTINPRETPPQVRVRPVVGGAPEAIMTLEKFREEYPLLRSKMIFARELFEATNPGEAAALGTGPTFDELFELADDYVETRVQAVGDSERRDIGIYYWARRALNILETARRRWEPQRCRSSAPRVFSTRRTCVASSGRASPPRARSATPTRFRVIRNLNGSLPTSSTAQVT